MSRSPDPLEPRALARLQRALTEQPRQQAPDALLRRLRAVECVVGLEAVQVPAELDERVALELETRVSVAGLLQNLGRQAAPSVLDRLVAEELAAPVKSVAERFIGDLPRVPAPSGEAPGRALRGRFGSRSWLGPASGLAAAVLGALLVGPYFGDSGSTPNVLSAAPAFIYSTAQVDSITALDPVAAALVNGLSSRALLEQTARRQAELVDPPLGAPQSLQPQPSPVGPVRVSVTGATTTSGAATTGSGAPATGIDSAAASGSGSLLELAANSDLTVPLDGERLVEILSPDGTLLAHRERLRVNGAGGTLLETTEVVSPGSLDPLEYKILQGPRAGFYLRYRDARVRDRDLLWNNYFVTELPGTLQVAGRTCVQLELTPTSAEAAVGQLRFTIDIETGVLLGLAEYDTLGQLGLRVTFESILYGEPATFVSHKARNSEQIMGAEELSSALGFELLNPVLLPDGFSMLERAAVAVEPGNRWSKATYTDGVEVLFFLHRAVDVGDHNSGAQRPGEPQVSGPLGSTVTLLDDQSTSKPLVWTVYELGSLKVIWGQVGNRDMVGVGRVGLDQLQLMLESAL